MTKIWLFFLIKSLPHNPNFQRHRERRLEKTLWQKDKTLVTSIFSPFYSALCPSQDITVFGFFSAILILSSAKCFQFDRELMFLS